MKFKVSYYNGKHNYVYGVNWESIKTTYTQAELKAMKSVQRVWDTPTAVESLTRALETQAEKIDGLNAELFATTATADALFETVDKLKAENAELRKTLELVRGGAA